MAEAERTPEEESRRNKSLAIPNCIVFYRDGTVLPLQISPVQLASDLEWSTVQQVRAAMDRGEYSSANMAGFLTFQTGVHPDVQRNGCQIEDVLQPLYERAEKLNEIVPSRETTEAILHIRGAWLWLKERTRMRRARGIEGSYKG